ncbi:Ribose operon repressor [Paraburkholderia aspalathi]|uniref:LacI family DNA-binding transcriptional regulator n=1 Tax=Paraburkholderia aspalathi TaxID=1324617 RepID=UPI00190D910C|nr:LacI family DNA-binding transcriptional regulator [Paraburkholderia aspalathi]MBK3844545.1 LacI family transcriptional regulator [Paraburkholderia aspalathi]CAE6866027.1 Ribose operon repressor [Paraburkholderia aspalathi]CAE6874154.1 Ribose operon repressor [Paraburkholderia aspalathi]
MALLNSDVKRRPPKSPGTVEPASAAQRATSYDVAIAAGVAQSTVSRCFQPDSPISPDTRAHVLAIAGQLGYRPNTLARSLILGRSNVVGVIVTRYTLRYNPELLFALAEALAVQGTKLLLMAVDSDDAVHSTLRDALEFPLDGLISCATMTDEDIAGFRRHGVPVAFLNRRVTSEGVDCVATDNVHATRQIADMLYRAGHRQFVCIGGPHGAPVSEERVTGFAGRLRELGVTDVVTVASDFSYDGGRAAFLEQASGSAQKIDAVFCANDQLALGALDACRFDLKLKVPDDISIVGFDDVAEASRPAYRLTTVHQQIEELATQAVRLLGERLTEPRMRPRTILVPGVLVRRASAHI